MSYEHTSVAVSKSQEAIRRLIMEHDGKGVAFVSHPPNEGFEAQILIEASTYHIRVTATCDPDARDEEQEQRRVWRVLYWHLKADFEASDSGVLEFRELMLPYIVTKDGKTIGDHLVPKLAEAVQTNPARLLEAGR